MKKEAVLTINELTIGFAQHAPPVVQKVSLALYPGKVTGLVGRSGSGKSMIAHAIAGLLPAAAKRREGKIIFHADNEKTELTASNERVLRLFRGKKIGMIFQEPQSALNPTSSCGAQLKEALRQHFPDLPAAELHVRALAWLKKVELTDDDRIMRSFPHQLSGGQQQRLLIAMAMAAEPLILLADEPTTALDTVVELNILLLLKKLVADQGTALLFISHDLAVIRFMAEEVLLIENGRIVQRGSTRDFFATSSEGPANKLLKESARLNFSLSQKNKVPVAVERTVLKISGLHCGYVIKRNLWGRATKKLAALRGIDLEIGAGEFVALIGRSGCGKSTLGRCINGLLANYEGIIEVMDKRGVAVQTVFQDPSSTLNPSLMCQSVIQEVVALHQPELSAVDQLAMTRDLFDRVGLPAEQFAHRYPEELSGGQRQRIAIARALAANPSLLICDEAVSALDADLQHEILELLAKLRQQTTLAILFISHDLALVAKHADRIVVMEAGKIVETVHPGNLSQTAKHPATLKLIRAAKLEHEASGS